MPADLQYRARYALAVLFAVNTMNFFDRQILGAVGEAIRREWSLGDTGLGGLGTAFTLLYAAAGLPFGRLADRKRRNVLLAIGVAMWSLLTAASGFAQNYWQLFAARLGVGIGEATCSPAATSLIGDLFPTRRRARAMSVFMLGLPVGVALSFGVGGWVAREWGWRAAFFVAGAPGILCAIAALAMREPPRGLSDVPGLGDRARPGSPYLVILRVPTMWFLIASGALHTFNTSALGVFLAPLLIRAHGLDIREAGLVATLVFGLPGLLSLVAWGSAADAAHQRRPNGRVLLIMGALALSVPLLILGFDRPRGDVVGFAILIGLAAGAMYAYYPAAYSTIHDVIEPSLRGTAVAVFFLAVYVFGASLGPLAIGRLSDGLAVRAAHDAGVTALTPAALEPFRSAALHKAMMVIPAVASVLTLALYGASRTIARDIERLRAWASEASQQA
jgi:MFS family permease